MGVCHFVIGRLLSAGQDVSGSVKGNPKIPIGLTGPKANTVSACCCLLIIVYALTLAADAYAFLQLFNSDSLSLTCYNICDRCKLCES